MQWRRFYGEVKIEKTDETFLSLFMEAYGLEVEEELSTMSTQYWADGVWTGKRRHEQKKAWRRQIQEVQMENHARGFAGAVMCETCDLGMKRAVLTHTGLL